MNKEQLIQSIKDLPDQYNINLQVIDNVIHITMTKKVDEFEEYCSKLDDETFNNACLIFGIISDISLEDFSSNLYKPEYKKYKQEFKRIVEFLMIETLRKINNIVPNLTISQLLEIINIINGPNLIIDNIGKEVPYNGRMTIDADDIRSNITNIGTYK